MKTTMLILVAMAASAQAVQWPVTPPCHTPIGTTLTGDIDGDGSVEILVAGESLDCLAAGGSVRWSYPATQYSIFMLGALADVNGSPATLETVCLQMTGTGQWTLLVISSNGTLLGSYYLGTPSSASPDFLVVDADVDGRSEIYLTQYVPTSLTRYDILPGPGGVTLQPRWAMADVPYFYASSPAAADLDGDGDLELVYTWSQLNTPTHEVRCVAADGSWIWTQVDYGEGSPIPVIADLDHDNRPEVLVPYESLICYEGQTGARRWSRSGYLGGLAAGDVDGDGRAEIFTLVPDPDHPNCSVERVNAQGVTVWSMLTNRFGFGTLVIADLDNDGKGEVIYGGSFSYDDIPSGIVVFDRNGLVEWSYDIALDNANPGPPALADLDGDGALEFVMTRVHTVEAVSSAGTPYQFTGRASPSTEASRWHMLGGGPARRSWVEPPAPSWPTPGAAGALVQTGPAGPMAPGSVIFASHPDVALSALLSGGAQAGLRIEVELKPAATDFDGTGLVRGGATGTGSPSTVTLTGVADGSWHWRARTANLFGVGVSAWTDFGTAGSMDFGVNVGTWTPSADERPRLKGCHASASGSWVVLALLALACFASRR